MITDMIGREIKVGDWVVSYNNIFEVLGLGKEIRPGTGYIKVILVNKSKTTRSKNISSCDACLLPADDVLVWKLKSGK